MAPKITPKTKTKKTKTATQETRGDKAGQAIAAAKMGVADLGKEVRKTPNNPTLTRAAGESDEMLGL